ncbi:zinc finger protein 665-like [Embiotoca jacksoni]|uniref:zinc finger protein 665-like n=1 Tax=Embiotoca jacksoni TaxID=100190 RepID=UPI00370480DE
MSRLQELKDSFKRRLITAARAHLIGHVERSISGYEEAIDRRRKLVDLLSNRDELRTAVFPADVQLLLVRRQKVPPVRQERSCSLDQENQENQEEPDGDGRDSGEASDQNLGHLQSNSDEKELDISEAESDQSEGTSKTKRWSCSARNKAFTKTHRPLRQRRRRTKKPPICSLCGETFPDRTLLVAHRKTHPENKRVSCSVCGLLFRFRSQLKGHMRIHTGEKPYSCSVCNRSFRWSRQVTYHRCVGLSWWRCSICGDTFLDRALLVAHKATHPENRPFICSVCGLQIKFRSQLEVHMRSHTGEKPYDAYVRKHMFSRTPVKPFSCKVCGKRFSWKFQIKEHKCTGRPAQQDPTGDRGPGPGLQREDNADSAFWKETRHHSSGFTYQRNRKSVSGAGCNSGRKPPSGPDDATRTKPRNDGRVGEGSVSDADRKTFIISESLKPAEGSSALQEQTQRNIEDGPLESAVVRRECVGESSRFHQNQTEEKIVVNKLWREETPEDLIPHLRRTSRGNTFRCSVCSAAFSDRDSLVQHMRSHSGQTQFTCSVCGRGFAWRRNLIKHMEVHKNKNMYRCNICPRRFRSQYSLRCHLRFHLPSQLHHSQTGPEPSRNPHPDPGDPDSDSCDPDTDDSDLWRQTREQESGFTSDKHQEVSESNATLHSHTSIQQDQDQQDPHIKEEQEEAQINSLPFSPVTVKTEEEEKPQWSQLHHSHTEENTDSVAAPGPGLKSDDGDFWTETRQLRSGLNSESESVRNPSRCADNKVSESLQPESDDSVDSDFWKETRKSPAGLNSVETTDAPDRKVVTSRKQEVRCPVCGKEVRNNHYLQRHMETHNKEKPFSCSVCGKKVKHMKTLQSHMSTHMKEKPHRCSVCSRRFAWFTELKYHQCVGESSR